MSMRDSVLLKNKCSSVQYMAAASTLVAEFSSIVVRAVASGFGNTFSLVYLMISDLPSAVDAGDWGWRGCQW